MAKTSRFSTIFWVMIVVIGLVAVLNTWLMRQATDGGVKAVVRAHAVTEEVSSTAKGIPKIDPKNDPLAPVVQNEPAPGDFLKRQPQTSSDEKQFEFSRKGEILDI